MGGFTPEETIGASVMAGAQNQAKRDRETEARIQGLEQRVASLEQEIVELRRLVLPLER